MSGYTKPCLFCKQEIRMSSDSGKWAAYNLDGSYHECRDKQSQPKQSQQNDTCTTTTPVVDALLEDVVRCLNKVEHFLQTQRK